MSQNRNKLIDLFIGNITNSIVHKILEQAVENSEISNKYNKELSTSFEIAKRYREKINPAHGPLLNKDRNNIKAKIINKVRSELMLRISKGYKDIDLSLIDIFVDKDLKDLNIID